MTAREEETFGGMPAWLLADYLVQLGGRRADEAHVVGPGWTATLAADGAAAGALRIRRVRVVVEGDQAPRIMAMLRRKAMRGGG